MEEEWEKMIDDNRENFDRMEEVPREAMWQGISNRLDRPARRPVMSWVGIAASLLLVFVAGMWYQHEQEKVDVVGLPEEWQAEENRYQQLIEFKKEEIGFDTFESARYPMLFEQLSHLDSEYKEAKVDYQTYPEEESLYSILIRYHEKQLEILEKLNRESDRNRNKQTSYENRIY